MGKLYKRRFIDYSEREDIINYAYDGDTDRKTEKVYINMTQEKLVSSVAYDCYSPDGKKIGTKGYGIWPASGGVWVADLDAKGKQV